MRPENSSPIPSQDPKRMVLNELSLIFLNLIQVFSTSISKWIISIQQCHCSPSIVSWHLLICKMLTIQLQSTHYRESICVSIGKGICTNTRLYQTVSALFMKILKPVFAQLCTEGHMVVGYLDDALIIGRSPEATQRAVSATTKLLTELGFLIHPDKSVLCPEQDLVFLGFHLDSRLMHIAR